MLYTVYHCTSVQRDQSSGHFKLEGTFLNVMDVYDWVAPNPEVTMNRRERQVLERRNEILAAARKLFETKGYPETSMEEIAETADVARGTLYNHFQSKAEVLVALSDSVAQEWVAVGHLNIAQGQSPRDAICDLLGAAGKALDEHPKAVAAYFHALREVMAKQEDAAQAPLSLVPREFVVQAQDKGELTTDLDADLICQLMEAVIQHNLVGILRGTLKEKVSLKIKGEAELVLSKLVH